MWVVTHTYTPQGSLQHGLLLEHVSNQLTRLVQITAEGSKLWPTAFHVVKGREG
jgi:hypothetical protein